MVSGTGKEAEAVEYAGENFVRFSGDTSKHAQAQMFAWEAQHAGVDVHLLAEPTKAEKLKLEYVGKKEEVKSSIQESILERYGGKEHLKVPPKALLLAQTEDYVEYSRTGKIIKGAEKPVVSSRYEEDIYINNHLSVSHTSGKHRGKKQEHELIFIHFLGMGFILEGWPMGFSMLSFAN